MFNVPLWVLPQQQLQRYQTPESDSLSISQPTTMRQEARASQVLSLLWTALRALLASWPRHSWGRFFNPSETFDLHKLKDIIITLCKLQRSTCAKEMKHHKYRLQLESFSAAAPNWYNNAPSTASMIKLSPVDHIRLCLCQPNWWNFKTTKKITDLCQTFAFQSQYTRMTEDVDQQVVCLV